MIIQLRPFHDREKLGRIYATPYVHTRWEDHKIRVATTIHVANWLVGKTDARSGADLSAGDGAILRALDLPDGKIFGDYRVGAHPKGEDWRQADLEKPETWAGITVDLVVLSETLEHVERPQDVLAHARKASRSIVVSTPVGEDNPVNPEHYWGWGTEDIRELLTDADFEPLTLTLLDPHVHGGYVYQIWACR